MKQKVVVILGPTASGKTGLSIALAKRFNGAVISADSRQVYRDLNIGTEKVTKKEMAGIPHFCIDVASPKRAFTVAQWRKRAEHAMHTIQKKGMLPIIAGGTGFYIDSLIYNEQFPKVEPNAKLRKVLEKKTTEELLTILTRLDQRRAQTVEQKNPRRLIRAIEVATELGKVPTLSKKRTHYNVTWVGINPGLEVLMERIEKRLDTTIRKGLIKEVRFIREELGLSWKRINELGLEYRTVGMYLRDEITKQEMKALMLRELRKYAKRQMTWMKRNEDIHWYTSAEEALSSLTTL